MSILERHDCSFFFIRRFIEKDFFEQGPDVYGASRTIEYDGRFRMYGREKWITKLEKPKGTLTLNLNFQLEAVDLSQSVINTDGLDHYGRFADRYAVVILILSSSWTCSSRLRQSESDVLGSMSVRGRLVSLSTRAWISRSITISRSEWLSFDRYHRNPRFGSIEVSHCLLACRVLMMMMDDSIDRWRNCVYTIFLHSMAKKQQWWSSKNMFLDVSSKASIMKQKWLLDFSKLVRHSQKQQTNWAWSEVTMYSKRQPRTNHDNRFKRTEKCSSMASFRQLFCFCSWLYFCGRQWIKTAGRFCTSHAVPDEYRDSLLFDDLFYSSNRLLTKVIHRFENRLGEESRVRLVKIAMEIVKSIRHKRSITIATNFQSCDSVSCFSWCLI